MAGDGNEFGAAGTPTVAAGRSRDGAGYFVRIDAAESGCLGEIPRLAKGPGGVRAAFLAVGEALIDAVAVGLIGDDEDPVVGPRRGGSGKGSYNGQGNQSGKGFHEAPK